MANLTPNTENSAINLDLSSPAASFSQTSSETEVNINELKNLLTAQVAKLWGEARFARGSENLSASELDAERIGQDNNTNISGNFIQKLGENLNVFSKNMYDHSPDLKREIASLRRTDRSALREAESLINQLVNEVDGGDVEHLSKALTEKVLTFRDKFVGLMSKSDFDQAERASLVKEFNRVFNLSGDTETLSETDADGNVTESLVFKIKNFSLSQLEADVKRSYRLMTSTEYDKVTVDAAYRMRGVLAKAGVHTGGAFLSVAVSPVINFVISAFTVGFSEAVVDKQFEERVEKASRNKKLSDLSHALNRELRSFDEYDLRNEELPKPLHPGQVNQAYSSTPGHSSYVASPFTQFEQLCAKYEETLKEKKELETTAREGGRPVTTAQSDYFNERLENDKRQLINAATYFLTNASTVTELVASGEGRISGATLSRYQDLEAKIKTVVTKLSEHKLIDSEDPDSSSASSAKSVLYNLVNQNSSVITDPARADFVKKIRRDEANAAEQFKERSDQEIKDQVHGRGLESLKKYGILTIFNATKNILAIFGTAFSELSSSPALNGEHVVGVTYSDDGRPFLELGEYISEKAKVIIGERLGFSSDSAICNFIGEHFQNISENFSKGDIDSFDSIFTNGGELAEAMGREYDFEMLTNSGLDALSDSARIDIDWLETSGFKHGRAFNFDVAQKVINSRIDTVANFSFFSSAGLGIITAIVASQVTQLKTNVAYNVPQTPFGPRFGDDVNQQAAVQVVIPQPVTNEENLSVTSTSNTAKNSLLVNSPIPDNPSPDYQLPNHPVQQNQINIHPAISQEINTPYHIEQGASSPTNPTLALIRQMQEARAKSSVPQPIVITESPFA